MQILKAHKALICCECYDQTWHKKVEKFLPAIDVRPLRTRNDAVETAKLWQQHKKKMIRAMNVLRIIACCGIMRNPHHKFSVSFLFSTSCFYQRLVQRRVPQSIVSNQQRMMGPRDTHSLSRKFFFAAFSFPPSSFACYPKFVLPATSHTNATQSWQLPIQLALTRTFFGCCLVWRVKSKRQLEIMLQAYNMTSKCGKKKAQHKKLLGIWAKVPLLPLPSFPIRMNSSCWKHDNNNKYWKLCNWEVFGGARVFFWARVNF